jgi:hypothetical protein
MKACFWMLFALAVFAGIPFPAYAIPATPRDVKSPPEYVREYRLAVKDAALGEQHSVLLLENGRLRCTGYNADGQCEPPTGLTGVVQVVAGDRFSAARDAAGKVTVWGRGPAGLSGFTALWVATDGKRLGTVLQDGRLWFSDTGLMDTGGAKLAKLVMSEYGAWTLAEDGTLSAVHEGDKKLETLTNDAVDLLPTSFKDQPVMALTKTGTLWLNPLHGIPSFGLGRINFIGDAGSGILIGTASGLILQWWPGTSKAPEFVTDVKFANVKFVRGSYGKCLYALKNGRVQLTGYDRAGSLLLGPPSKPKRISSYDSSHFVLREDGEVVSFGRSVIEDANEVGPYFPVWRGGIKDVKMFAGSYFVAADKLEAFGIIDEGLLDIPAELKRVEQVEWGINWVLARTADGKLMTWGSRAASFKLPVTKLRCVQASATSYSGVSLYEDGSVFEWGDTPASYADNADIMTARPALPKEIKAVAAGSWHVLALAADGSVFAWGANRNGQCSVPGDLAGATAIAGGWDYSAALLADGTLRVWGKHAAPAADTPLLAIIAAGRDGITGISKDRKVVAISAATGKAVTVPLYGIFDRP